MAKVPDLQVVLPYKTLVELLEAAQSVSTLNRTVEFQQQQILAIRNQLSEVFEVIGDIKSELRTFHD